MLRRGIALVVVLSFLMLLSMFTATFLQIRSIEHSSALAFVDGVRARLMAESGLEAASAELDHIFTSGGGLDGDNRWIWSADRPSFASDTVTIDGLPTLVSGRMATGDDVYLLRIEDESGKINVNDGVRWGPGHLTSRNTARMLNALGKQLAPPVPDLGARLLASRPPAGYANLEELRAILGADLWERARPHVTVFGWSDPNVANPVPLSSAVIDQYPFPADTYLRPPFDNGDGSPKLFRLGHQHDYKRHNDGRPLRFYEPSGAPYHNAIYEHDSLNPLWVEVTARSPVNVHTASREVLTALLTDLQGFFSSIERRRDRPRSRAPDAATPDNYRWFKYQVYTYSPAGARANEDPISAQHPPGPDGGDGDECGFLYTTMKYGDGAGVGVIDARTIADHIIAGRPFAGWAQFHDFVDHLAREDVAVIAENRGDRFFDYYRAGTPMAGPSSVQMRLASQAAADVLKANFNPNLNLNELNPDRNLFLHVDKTDLLVHSTEFCFVPPTGCFSVESTGLALRPDGSVGARRTARAVYQLWEAERQTSMAHFYGGAGALYSPRQSAFSTSNNRSVEVGPEPDNGPIAGSGVSPQQRLPMEIFTGHNRFSGYVALSTMGGPIADPLTHKPWNSWIASADFRGAAVFPPAWSDPLVANGRHDGIAGEKIHAHFSHDAACHFHSDRDRQNLGDGVGMAAGAWRMAWRDWPPGLPGRSIDLQNVPDRPDRAAFPGQLGLYEPTSWWPRAGGAAGRLTEARHRLCRAFTPDPSGVFTWDPPGDGPHPAAYAPSDLRIDGLYSEHNSTPGYVITDLEAFEFDSSPATIDASSWRFREATTSFWLKPNWFPECTGKIRTLLDMSRVKSHVEAVRLEDGYALRFPTGLEHDAAAEADTMPSDFHQAVAVIPFGLFYFPAHADAAGGPVSFPDASLETAYDTASGTGRIRPASLGFGTGFNRHNGDWFGRALRDRAFHAAGDPRALPAGALANFRSVLHDAVLTPTLNHEGHGAPDNHDPLTGEDGGFNWLRGHEWVHVTVSWKIPVGTPPTGHTFQIFLNGRPVPGSVGRPHHYSDEPDGTAAFPPDAYPWHFLHEAVVAAADGTTTVAGNTLRLGGGPCEIVGDLGREPSFRSPQDPFPLRFSADATYDELYHWDRTGGTGSAVVARPMLDEAWALWSRGRYARPTDPSPGDFSQTTFVTAPFLLPTPPPRLHAAPAERGALDVGTALPAAPEPLKIIGLSWTIYGERGGTTLLDWSDPTAPQPIPPLVTADANGAMVPALGDLYVMDAARVAGPFRREGFSRVGTDVSGPVRVRLKFRIDAAEPTLLATPVFEDVTLYYRRGRAPRLLSCCWSTP